MNTTMTGTEFETGRYLYCAVRASETEGTDLSVIGVDDESVYLVVANTTDSLGVVVHECDSLYDTAEENVLRQWLLQHQSVIDAAGEAFGTPLPFQFDSIVTGTDERVQTWLDKESDTLSRYLDSLAGHWEYRIEIRCDETRIETELEATDERLTELEKRIADASEGTRHLLEKQYEQHITGLKRKRRKERATTLEARLDPLAREVYELDVQQTTLTTEQASLNTDSRKTQARFAVLAVAEQENAIGDLLDEIADEPGVEVRFTGPWPPYTFTPTIGGDNETDTRD